MTSSYHFHIERHGRQWRIIGTRRTMQRTPSGGLKVRNPFREPPRPITFATFESEAEAAYHLGALESRLTLAPARA